MIVDYFLATPAKPMDETAGSGRDADPDCCCRVARECTSGLDTTAGQNAYERLFVYEHV